MRGGSGMGRSPRSQSSVKVRAGVSRAASRGGIRTVRANWLPADKVAAVRDLARGHGNVMMVGDVINEAPSRAEATVGVAMGALGTAGSAEAADVVLLVDDTARLGDAMAI